MDCMNGDMPHWCATNTATSKEIWVEPVNRFLGAVSIYASENNKGLKRREKGNDIQINTKASRPENGIISVVITLTGSGNHSLDIKTFNASTEPIIKNIDLSDNITKEIKLELKVIDINKPYIALITVDKNPELRKEIAGSINDVSF